MKRLLLLVPFLLRFAALPAGADPLPAEFSATQPPPKPPPVAKPPGSPKNPPLYRDETVYPPLHLTWGQVPEVTQAEHIFTHPTLAQIALLTTESGVSLTTDFGKTWTELPGATVAKVGVINDVAFQPLAQDTFYLASQTSGLWITTDFGKTFRPLADKSKGLAADAVAGVIVYPGDPTEQTLLAVHGEAAPGISRSRDGGATWDVVNTDYHFSRAFGAEGTGKQLYLFGSSLKEPSIQSVFSCLTVGEFLTEVVRDVVPTDLNLTPVPSRKPGFAYLTTTDSGLERIDNASTFGMAYDVRKLAYPQMDGWASVGATWGASADNFNLYLYDPSKLGLIVVPQDIMDKTSPGDDLTVGVTASEGLPVSALTKEGAVLRPNANGTVFYAVENGALLIGRQPPEVPVVEVSPGAFAISTEEDAKWRKLGEAFASFAHAKGSTLDAATELAQSADDLVATYNARKLTITARVPVQPAPPASVTVDLSRYGGDPHTLLYDDGRHDDGAAHDGVYGLSFAFLPSRYNRDNAEEWRARGPGRVAVGVTAAYADGTKYGAVGVVNILKQLSDVTLLSEKGNASAITTEGNVTTETFANPLAPGQPAYASRRHQGDAAVRIVATKGPWSVHFRMAYNKHDIDSCAAISLYLRLEAGTSPKELYFQLHDMPEFSSPMTTDRVPLLNGLVLNADYQRIVLSMKQVVGSSMQLQLNHLDEVILSGDAGDSPVTLVLDGLQAITTLPSPASSKSAP